MYLVVAQCLTNCLCSYIACSCLRILCRCNCRTSLEDNMWIRVISNHVYVIQLFIEGIRQWRFLINIPYNDINNWSECCRKGFSTLLYRPNLALCISRQVASSDFLQRYNIIVITNKTNTATPIKIPMEATPVINVTRYSHEISNLAVLAHPQSLTNVLTWS